MARDILQDISDHGKRAIFFLAACFNFAKEMVEDEEEIQQDLSGDKYDEATKELRKLMRNFKLAARSERREARAEKDFREDLETLQDLLSDEEKERLAKFAKQLDVTSGHLKSLASFYRGELREDIGELEDDIRSEERYHDLIEQLPGDTGLQKKLKRADLETKTALEELSKETQELSKWLSSQTALVKQIVGWAEQLAD